MHAFRCPLIRAAPPIALALAFVPGARAEPPAQTSVVGVVEPRRPTEPVVPAPAPARPAPAETELTAADVAAAPVPGYESGRVDPVDGGDSTWREIGRGILFVPRLAIDAVLSPARAAIWAEDRYHLGDLYTRTFYNTTETIGLYPTIAVDSALGVTAGAGFVHKDLLGEHEHEQLGLQFSLSNRYRQIYAATLSSGDRLGHRFGLELDAGYERRPHDAFYGIGNGDRITGPRPEDAPPIDPRFDATSIESHYRQARARLAVTADWRAWRQLHIRTAAAVSEVGFGAPDEGAAIDRVYDPRGLVGWGSVRYGYGELELRWDDRHGVTVFEPSAVSSAGSLAAVFGGRMHRLDDGPDFWRYGVDLAKFFRLAQGPRLLIAHLHGEAVTGGRDEVPFTELPKLGGPTYLRGYALDQFRDRVAAFGSLAYAWDLSQWFQASIFVDVGRVYPEVTDLSLDHLRAGYGVALEAHRVESFVLEASLGSSIDGGLFLNLSFNPVYDIDQRVRRR